MNQLFTKLKNLIGLIGLIGLLLGNATGLIGQELRTTPKIGGPITVVKTDGAYTYVGGVFSLVGTVSEPLYTTSGVLANPSTGEITTDLNMSATPIAAVSDGAGGLFIGGFGSLEGYAGNQVVHLLSDGTVDPNFTVSISGGRVFALAYDGTSLYIGGEFTSVNGESRLRLAKLNAADGSLVTTWSANAEGGSRNVEALALAGGSLFVGGKFLTIGGVSQAYVAKVSVTDGAVDTGWAPTFDDPVFTLLPEGSSIFVGGEFRNVNATFMDRLVKLNQSDGAIDSSWAWTRSVSASAVDKVNDLAIDGNNLFVVGGFSIRASNGANMQNIIKVDATTGADDVSWNALLDNASQIEDIYDDGTHLYLAGTFDEDPANPRTNIIRISKADGSLDTAFDLLSSTATVTDKLNVVAPLGSQLFVGGAARYFGGMRTNESLIRYNSGTGLPDLSWNPQLNGTTVSISDILIEENDVYVAGTFATVAGEDKLRITKINKETGIPYLDWGNITFFSGTPGSIAIDDTHVYIGGGFNNINLESFGNLVRLNKADGTLDTSWKPVFNNAVYKIHLNGNDLYAGGSFSTVNGESISALAKLNKTTGAVDTNWSLNPISGSSIPIIFDFVIDGADMYVAGRYSEIGGITGTNVANVTKLDLASADPYIAWGSEVNNIVRTIEVTEEHVYVGGEFSRIDSNNTHQKIARLNKADGSVDNSFDLPVTNTISSQIDQVYDIDLNGQILTYGSDDDLLLNGSATSLASFLLCENCSEQVQNLACGTFTTGSSGELIFDNQAYIDTLTATDGSESYVYVYTSTEVNQVYEQNLFATDTLIAGQENLNYTASNNFASYAKFDRFDNDWVNLNATVSRLANSDRSAFMWVKPSANYPDFSTSSLQVLLGVNDFNGDIITALQTDEQVTGTEKELRLRVPGANLNTGVTLTPEQWYHIGFTYDQTTQETTVYVDGQSVFTHTLEVTIPSNGLISLGQLYGSVAGFENYYDGSMTEVSLWDAVLTPAEIVTIRTARIENTHPKYANLIGYYSMNNDCGLNSGGTEVYDYSGNDLHGTATANDIVVTSDMETISAFNGAGWFNKYWIAPDGSTLSTDASIDQLVSAAGTYQLLMLNRHFAITEEWDIVTCTNCERVEDQLCGEVATDSNGTIYFTDATFTNTVTATGGGENLVFVTVTSEVNQVNQQDIFSDTTLVAGEDLNLTASTNYAAYGKFDRAEQDWVAINGAAALLDNTNRSVFMWMRQPNAQATAQVLLGINTSTGGAVSNFFVASDGELSINHGTAAVSSNTVVSDGQWHHVGYTYDETSNLTIMYVDGVNVGQFTNAQSVSAISQLSLGQEFDNATTSDFYEGEMTEVSLWNEVLSANDIALLMQGKIEDSHPKKVNLVAYYPMLNDCGQTSGGTAVYDYSGNNYHGTASATNIVNTAEMATINGFNGVGWFNTYWIAPDGSTLSSTPTLNASSPAVGKYQLALVNRHFAVADAWNVATCTDCSRENNTLCKDIATDWKGNVYIQTSSFTDTLSVDPLTEKLVNVVSEVNQVYAQDAIADEALEGGVNNLTHAVSTNYTAYGKFDSADEDWIEINGVAPSLAGSSRSVFVWMRKDSQVSGSAQVLVGVNRSGGSPNVCLLMVQTDEELVLEVNGTERSSNVVVTDGQWHHVGYTYDINTHETIIYVDGVNTSNFTSDQAPASTDLYSIGQEFDSGLATSNFYDGEMTEVSIWNEVLTEGEVALLMQQKVEDTHPKKANLLAYYPMLNDCGQNTGGTEVYDFSGNNFHGTATANSIVNTQSLGTIPNFNGAGWFNSFWTAPDGSTVSTAYSIEESTYTSGTYRNTLVNRHFAITEEWVVTATGFNTDPTIAEAILDRTALYAQADSTFNIAANFTDAENPNDLTFTVQGNTDNTVVTATVNGNDLNLDFGLVGSSELTIRATDPDGGFVDDAFTVTVNKATPMISFTSAKSVGINTGDVASQLVLTATSNADGTNTNPITFELVSGPATFDGGTNTLTFGQTHGTVQVRATQAESDYYLAGTKTENITVRRPRIITSDVEFFDFEAGDYGSKSFTVSGEDLIGDVTIQAPSNLEISTDNVTFGPQVILPKVVDGNDLLNEPVTLTTRFVANPTPPFFDSYFIDYTTDQAQTTTSEVEVLICQSATDICATATTVNSEQILVRWIDKAGSGAESYQVERATEDVEGSYQLIHTETATGATAYSFTDTELTPGTTYFYRVRWVKN